LLRSTIAKQLNAAAGVEITTSAAAAIVQEIRDPRMELPFLENAEPLSS
jgi:hypothetical protein